MLLVFLMLVSDWLQFFADCLAYEVASVNPLLLHGFVNHPDDVGFFSENDEFLSFHHHCSRKAYIA